MSKCLQYIPCKYHVILTLILHTGYISRISNCKCWLHLLYLMSDKNSFSDKKRRLNGMYSKVIILLYSLILISTPAIGDRFGACEPRSLPSPTDTDPPWKLLRDQNGVLVYSHPMPGSDFAIYKTDTILDASLDSVIAMALDLEHAQEWMPRALSVEVIDYPTNDSITYYTAMDAPWPIMDRDAVTTVKITRDPGKNVTTFTYKAEIDYIPKRPGFIRIPWTIGTWTLIPLQDGRVRSIRQGITDPGGWLPAWIVDWAIDTIMLEGENNVKRQLLNPRYKKANLHETDIYLDITSRNAGYVDKNNIIFREID